MLFRADLARQRGAKPSAATTIGLQSTIRFATQLFHVASAFYRSPRVELPGYIDLAIGLIDVLGFRMVSQPTEIDHRSGQTFLDDDFGADVRMPIDQFLASPSNAAIPLFENLKFGFDL